MDSPGIIFSIQVSVDFADILLGYDKLKELLVEVIRPLVEGRNVFGNFPMPQYMCGSTYLVWPCPQFLST